MVEIGKALSYDAKLLIMDEPTAALNDAEVEVLHDLIRRFVQPDTGVIYISHRMDELKRIADRITVIRDGQLRRDARDRGDDHEGGHLHDGRARDLRRGASRSASSEDREVVLEVAGLSTKALLKDVSFDLRKGEILGFAGLMGAGRTEVARALVGADKTDAGTVKLRGREIQIRNPADAAKHRIGYLSEDRKQFGLLLEQEVNANIGLSALRERFQSCGFVKDAAMRATSREYVDTLRIRTPVGRPDGQEPLGRQPAEGRHRQVARQGLRHPHLRRADPRHRRRREGGDLPAPQRARAAGQVDHHDLVRAAGDPADVAPHRRHERGPGHRRARRRRGHAGERHALRDAATRREPRGRRRARAHRAGQRPSAGRSDEGHDGVRGHRRGTGASAPRVEAVGTGLQGPAAAVPRLREPDRRSSSSSRSPAPTSSTTTTSRRSSSRPW